MSNHEINSAQKPDSDTNSESKNPLDLFPVHFKATKGNRWIRLALHILCYLYALNITYVVVTLMNGPDLDLTGQPTFHFPVLEHTWGFLVRSIINQVMSSVLILMLVIMFISILSYKDILTDKYQARLKEVSLTEKATLLFEHYLETCFINVLFLFKYIVKAIILGILLGWCLQVLN